MHQLIKSIREYLNISQVEFAKELGVTFQTMNRWENARAVPTKLAQATLYDFCKKHAVPVFDMIIHKIETTTKEIHLQNGRILLYHGSKSGIIGDIAPKSRKFCDFGQGFYMGNEISQPLTLIADFEKSKFYIVSIDIDDLHTLEINVDLDWAMLVAYLRGRMETIKDTALYNKYRTMTKDKDLVIGNIANDRMFYVLDNFFLGNITDEALIHSLSILKLGKQYVAITQKACQLVQIEKEIPLSFFEKRIIQDKSEENRIKGVNLAKDICKNYRREGKYFDEILDEAK